MGKKLTGPGKKSDISPEKVRKKIVFALFCIIVFWGISFTWIIGDYMTIPQKRNIEGWNVLEDIKTNYHNIITEKKGLFDISIGDSKITGIELYIIVLFGGFGFLRLIDFLYYMEKYNNF